MLKDKAKYLLLSCTVGAISGYILSKALKKKPKKKTRKPSSHQSIPHIVSNLRRLQHLKEECELIKELKYLDQPTCKVYTPDHLIFDLELPQFESRDTPLLGDHSVRKVDGGGFMDESSFVDSQNYVISNVDFNQVIQIQNSEQFLRAGPRKKIYWEKSNVRAAIVTCGDLVPGLNTIIRELVMCLFYNYEVKKIYGVKYSFKGFKDYDLMQLTPEDIKGIHHQGGSILGCSKDEIDTAQIVNSLCKNKINQLYMIGDLKDHEKLKDIYKLIKKRGLEIGVAGIGKSVDNHFPLSDHSFGFDSQVEQSMKAMNSAITLCQCKENGVSVVQVPGENTGYICMESSLLISKVNVCLIPEMEFNLHGKNGVLEYVYSYLQKNSHCMIVVAEGASKSILDPEGKCEDIGSYIADQINQYCCKKLKKNIKVDYYDVRNQVRTVQSNSFDSKYCSALAQNAIHGLMAGFTNFSCLRLNGRVCYLPLDCVLSDKVIFQVSSPNKSSPLIVCGNVY